MASRDSVRLDSRTIRGGIRNTILSQAVGSILPQVLLEGGVLSLLVLYFGGTDLHVGIVSTAYNATMVVPCSPIHPPA